MQLTVKRLIFLALAIFLTSCAQTETAMAKPASTTHFEGDGRVSFHKGQPCSPQIMFDLQVATLPKQVVWVAAPHKESEILNDAVKYRRRVHISGTWKRGRDKQCNFVSVIRVTVGR